MKPKLCYMLTYLVFFLFMLPSNGQSSNISIASLDSTVRDFALDAVEGGRTGILYQVPLPPNLSGIEVAVMRLRSGYFWSTGANLSAIYVPPRTTTIPTVRRLAIVYQNLGNRSASYYNLPGYSLVAPIIGCLAYDESNFSSSSNREVEFQLAGDPITVIFTEMKVPKGSTSDAQCALIAANGTVQLGAMASENMCYTTTTGHYTVVVPSQISSSRPAVVETSENRWRFWVAVCGGGVVGVVIVGLVVVGIFRLARTKKMVSKQRQADDGEALGSMWVSRNSKMPSAPMTRTRPYLENSCLP